MGGQWGIALQSLLPGDWKPIVVAGGAMGDCFAIVVAGGAMGGLLRKPGGLLRKPVVAQAPNLFVICLRKIYQKIPHILQR